MPNPNKQELLFLHTIADKNKTYIYHPQWFYFKNGTKYMPDFYCENDNTFIEISGTKQAYHFNKHKYEKMKCEFPHINFRIIRLDKTERKLKVYDFPESEGNLSCLTTPLYKKIVADLRRQSLNSLAKEIGIKQSTLWRIVNKQTLGSMKIWGKIERFYNK